MSKRSLKTAVKAVEWIGLVMLEIYGVSLSLCNVHSFNVLTVIIVSYIDVYDIYIIVWS